MYIFLLYSISRFRCLKNCQYSVSLVQLVGDLSINNVFPGFNTEAGCDTTDKVSTKKAALRPVYQSRKNLVNFIKYCKAHSKSFLSNLYFAKFGL